MKKYIYYLQDSPQYPNEIYATSKEEVKSLILESIGPDNEGMILNIIEANSINKNPNVAAIYNDSDSYSSGAEFFNEVIKAGTIAGKNNTNLENELTKVLDNNSQIQQNQNINAQKSTNENKSSITHNVKYFEEGGFKFKLEDGKVYKKTWIDVSTLDEFRIINISTKKIVNSEKYKIEKLDWVEL